MELLQQIEGYLDASRMAPSRFGRNAVGDPRLVDDLRAGRKLRDQTRERVAAYMRDAAGSARNRRSA